MQKFQNKEQAIKWALSLMARSDIWYIMDYETVSKPDYKTGYFPEPCQIAIINSQGEKILSTLIKPKTAIHPDAQKVHGISQLDVKDAPRWPELYDHLRDMLHDKTVIAYNASFEQGCTNAVNNLYTLPLFTPKWECAMLAFSAFMGTPGLYGGFKWYKLTEACSMYEIETKNAHSALADVLMTLELIKVMANG